MNDIVVGFLVGVVAGVLLFWMAIKLAVYVLKKRLEEHFENLETALKDQIDAIACRVELHNGHYYVYNNDTDEFMAQGQSLLELKERIKDRWADRRVSLVAGDEQVLESLRKQLNESSNSQ